MNVFANNPRGYCAGVVRAINMAKDAKNYNKTKSVFVFGDLVHNEEVIADLTKNGVTTLPNDANYKKTLDALPKQSIVIFTAHGHVQEVEDYARKLGYSVIDATCERVKANLDIARKALEEGKDVIYIGKAKHPETAAMISISSRIHLYEENKPFDYKCLDGKEVLVLNQTTLSYIEIKNIHEDIIRHCPNAKILDEICDATKLRQQSIFKLPNTIDLVFVVGGSKSSNTAKLSEISKKRFPNIAVIRILNVDDIKKSDLIGHNNVAVISGASTPIETSNKIIDYLKSV